MEKKQKKEWKKPELVDFDNRNTNNNEFKGFGYDGSFRYPTS